MLPDAHQLERHSAQGGTPAISGGPNGLNAQHAGQMIIGAERMLFDEFELHVRVMLDELKLLLASTISANSP